MLSRVSGELLAAWSGWGQGGAQSFRLPPTTYLRCQTKWMGAKREHKALPKVKFLYFLRKKVSLHRGWRTSLPDEGQTAQQPVDLRGSRLLLDGDDYHSKEPIMTHDSTPSVDSGFTRCLFAAHMEMQRTHTSKPPWRVDSGCGYVHQEINT